MFQIRWTPVDIKENVSWLHFHLAANYPGLFSSLFIIHVITIRSIEVAKILTPFLICRLLMVDILNT